MAAAVLAVALIGTILPLAGLAVLDFRAKTDQ